MPTLRGRIEEGEKAAMLAAGEWVPTHPDKKKRELPAVRPLFPARMGLWGQIAQEFIAARKSKERLKTWSQHRMGEPFEEAGEQPARADLKARCLPYEP